MEENKTNVPATFALPTIAQLFEDNIEVAYKNEQLNLLLNKPPNPKWIKEHPFIPGYKYLPIDKIEFMLGYIFKQFRIEVLKTGMLLNAVECQVRVWYLSPATGKMEYHDGVGAQEIQTTKDSGTLKLDMSNINRGAVTMALPIAKTLAVKDACDHFGKVFGRDLNRKDAIVYAVEGSTMDATLSFPAEIKEQLDLVTDIDGLNKYVWQVTTADKKLNSNMGFRSYVTKRTKELEPKTN